MTPRPFVLLLVLAAAISPTLHAAAVAENGAPRFFGGLAAVRSTCQALADQPPPRRVETPLPAGETEPSGDGLRACIQLLSEALSSSELAEEGKGLPEAIRERRLLQTWRAIERVAPWVKRADALGQAPRLADEFEALEVRAHAVLRAHGLLGGSYAAAVRGGVVVAEPGGQVGAVPGAATHGETAAYLTLDAETRPLDLGLGWGASIGLEVGRQPVLAMVTAAGPAEPIYKNGTSVSTGLRFARASRVVELAAVSRAGAARIDLGPTMLTSRGTTRMYAAAANDVDEWALFFDARLDLRWYDHDVWAARLAMETLDPLLRASVGIRHDERFHRAGDLEPFNDPTGRVFFGFALHPVRVGAFSAGSGFEFEGALRGAHRLPSGYRVFAEATLDLQRAFRRLGPR